MTKNELITGDMQPEMRPLFLAENKVAEETSKAWKGKSQKQIEREHEKVTHQIKAAFDEGKTEDGKFDIANTKETLGEGTPADQADKIVKLNGEAAGLLDVMRYNDELARRAESIEQHGTINGPRNAEGARQVGATAEVGVDKMVSNLLGKLPNGIQDFKDTIGSSNTHEFKFDLGAIAGEMGLRNDISYTAQIIRDGTHVPVPQRRPQMLDFFQKILRPNSGGGISWMEENVDRAAGSPAITPAKGDPVEQSYGWVPRTSQFVKVTSFVPVTEEQMADVPEAVRMIRQLLLADLVRFIDDEIANGGGTGFDPADWNGVLNKTGIQVQQVDRAGGAWTVAAYDAILDGKRKIMSGRGGTAGGSLTTPNVVFLHSGFIMSLKKLRNSDGNYYLGGPRADTLRETLWGMQGVEVDNSGFDSGSDNDQVGLVADTDFGVVHLERDARIETGYSGAGFLQGVQSIRGVVRGNLAIRNAKAFCRLDQNGA